MSETAEKYIPQVAVKPAPDKTGLKIWLVLFFLSTLWMALIIAAPLLRQAGHDLASADLYYAFGFICHQISERSFHIHDDKLAVCARCFGVYSGLFFGFVFYPLFRSLGDIRPLPKVWLILSTFPLVIDWALTFFGVWENTHLSRFLTGAILGAACAVYILPALIEISFYLLQKTHRTESS